MSEGIQRSVFMYKFIATYFDFCMLSILDLSHGLVELIYIYTKTHFDDYKDLYFNSSADGYLKLWRKFPVSS